MAKKPDKKNSGKKERSASEEQRRKEREEKGKQKNETAATSDDAKAERDDTATVTAAAEPVPETTEESGKKGKDSAKLDGKKDRTGKKKRKKKASATANDKEKSPQGESLLIPATVEAVKGPLVRTDSEDVGDTDAPPAIRQSNKTEDPQPSETKLDEVKEKEPKDNKSKKRKKTKKRSKNEGDDAAKADDSAVVHNDQPSDEAEKTAAASPSPKKGGFFSFRKSKEARESERKGDAPAEPSVIDNITAPLAAVANAIPDALASVIPDAVSDAAKTIVHIPGAVTAAVVDTMRSAVQQLESLTQTTEQNAMDIQIERDTKLLELYGRTADFTACAERANALVWQRGLTPTNVITTAELHPVDCDNIVDDLQQRVAAYEAEIAALKSRSLDVAVQRHAQAAINRELQDVRLKKASNAIREENRFRKALALQASKLTGLKEQISTAKRVTREMKHAHLAIAEEQFDIGNELLKIREEARILTIEDRDAHARHIYKTFQELLDESKNLKATKGNERDELESLLRAFRQLDDLSTHQHVRMHEFYFQPFSERLQQIQAVYRDLLMQEEFRTVGKLPDALFSDISHISARYNVLEVEHAIRLEEEARDTLLKALRTTLDSLSVEK